MPVNVLDVWTVRYLDTRQQSWVRVAAYAEARAKPNGHAPLTTGELRKALGFSNQQVSRAIRTAIREDWLHPASSARCLVLARGDIGALCPAIHRGDV